MKQPLVETLCEPVLSEDGTLRDRIERVDLTQVRPVCIMECTSMLRVTDEMCFVLAWLFILCMHF